ncbi:DNA polymerase III subunit delta [Mesomycoplasma ovipneumoniae]
MFFIIGSDNFLVQEKIFRLPEIKNSLLINFFVNDSLDFIQENLEGSSLFDEKKVLIFNNFLLFSKNEKLNNLLASKITKTKHTIIFKYVFDENLTNFALKNSWIYKHFASQAAKIIEVQQITKQNVGKFIAQMVKKFNVELETTKIFELESVLPLNGWIIYNEIAKLKTLNKPINSAIIRQYISDYSSYSTWGFIESFVDFDLTKVLKFYRQKLLEGHTISLLLGQINSKLLLSFIVFLYKKAGKKDSYITKNLNISDFQLKKAVELYNKNGIKKIEKLIINLAKLDTEIKTSQINNKIAFELYLLQVLR